MPSKELPPDTELQRAPLLEAQVEIEIAAGNIDRARSAADELKLVAARFHSKALVAGATLAQGRVRLAEGDAADAERLFSEAARLWNEVGAPMRRRAHGWVSPKRSAPAAASSRPTWSAGRRVRSSSEIEAARTTVPAREVAGRNGEERACRRTSASFVARVTTGRSAFDGHTVRVRDLKGMRYLARLLANPGREFHVLDLVAAETGEHCAGGERPNGRAAARGLGDAGEILDARAKNAYRRRLAEIEDDIEQARALGDAERAAQADTERDFLVRELSRAVGLGGRDRRAASASERARVAVTRAIRQAMARSVSTIPSSASISTVPSAPARIAPTFPTLAREQGGGLDAEVTRQRERAIIPRSRAATADASSSTSGRFAAKPAALAAEGPRGHGFCFKE